MIEKPDLSPTLHGLIAASAAPLRSVESAFAVDSTGFGTQSFYRHFSAKYGRERVRCSHLKLHALIGTKTNVIGAARITNESGDDYSEFAPLLKAAAQTFDISEVSADKAYVGRTNLAAVDAVGAQAFIPMRKGMVDDPKSPLWSKLFHLYNYRIDEFLPHYHRRSNAESTFSAMKRTLGDTIWSKGAEAQVNELLLKVLAFNIVTMVHSIFELGVTVPGLSFGTRRVINAHLNGEV